MASKRPELQAPPEYFYNEVEAQKYTSNSRMMEIQSQLTDRALELLALPDNEPCFLLDIGCGSGLSGEVLTEHGHTWVGFDISSAMLNVALEREVDGDLMLLDAGMGVPFRAGTFDACVSISALQWLCNADVSHHNPVKRLSKFFTSLYSSLRRGGKAVLQFYPSGADQAELITNQAMRSGFTGGVIVDYPNSTRAKKMFLMLFAGGAASAVVPRGLGGAEAANTTVSYSSVRERTKFQRTGGKPAKKSREWVTNKKERKRRQGKDVRPDSKFTARKRKPKF